MRKYHLMLALAAALAGLPLLAGHALADRFRFLTSDGPLILQVHPDGSVDGYYPEKRGRIIGRVEADGSIRGFWQQPRSDHPCEQRRGDTHSWGTFVLSDPYARGISARYGYCGEQPRRAWEMSRD